MPCKHMFAAIEKHNELSQESFSENYRNSPFFNLDTAVLEDICVGKQLEVQDNNSDNGKDIKHFVGNGEDGDDCEFSELPV